MYAFRSLRVVLPCLLLSSAPAQEAAQPAPETAAQAEPVPLNPERTVLLDKPGRRLLLKTQVCLRLGVLEMLACPKQTKEHESILSFPGKAQAVHAGLLALDLTPGRPARFAEKFEPPTGPKLDVYVSWQDAAGKPQRRPAREWIRHVTYRYFAAKLSKVPPGVPIDQGDDTLRYDPNTQELLWFGIMSNERRDFLLKHSNDPAYQQAVRSLYEQSQPRELMAEWVFAGSGFSTTEDGRQIYQAEAGSLICVANFGDALIDINVESSASNGAQLFEPYTERIPPEGTPVTIEIMPAAVTAKTR